MAFNNNRRAHSSHTSFSGRLAEMANPLAKPWTKLKGIMSDDYSRKDFIKRMQHPSRTPPSSHIHTRYSARLPSTTDNNFPSSSPTGSRQASPSRALYHHQTSATSSGHYDSGGGSSSNSPGLAEIVSDFAGGGAVSIPFFIPPTRFNDSARSSITGGGSHNSSSPHSSPSVSSTKGSKKWQKLRLISSIAVRPSQAFAERRSSAVERNGGAELEDQSQQNRNVLLGGQPKHLPHDKLRQLRQRPTQFELQVPSTASSSSSNSTDKTAGGHAAPVSGVLFRHTRTATSSNLIAANSGPSTRVHSPNKQQHQRSPQRASIRAPPSPSQQHRRPSIVVINTDESASMPPVISISDEFCSQQKPEQNRRHRHSPETTPRSNSAGKASPAKPSDTVEPDDGSNASSFLGINTNDSRIRRQSCESKYWDCPEAPAQSLLLKIPQRDTMYQRRRSSTFQNLNELLNGIDTAAAAESTLAQATSQTELFTKTAVGSTSPSTTKRNTSPSSTPDASQLRRRPTASALLLNGNGNESAMRSNSSDAGPKTANTRQRARHLSVTHVSSADLFSNPRSASGSRQQSMSPQNLSLAANSRQMSVSAENLAEIMLDDNQIALLRAENQAIATRGEVKIALVYLHEEKTLKVTVYKAENLGKNRRDISSYVAACLLPGKEQKQQSRLIKSNKNPPYNEEFYFPGRRWHELSQMILRISIYNELTVGKECLGEVLIPLGTVDEPTVEQRMWRNPMLNNAFVQLRLCFNAGVRKVIVTVMKVHNVRGAMTFLPDVYVKAELWQNHKQMDKRSTKVAKRTNNPVFKEAFAFHLNITKEEMSFTTIKVTLMATAAIGSDGPVGQVILGYGATEDTENEQWRNAIRDPGKEFTKWHALLPVD